MNWSLVVHGGSGVIERADLKPEQDRAYRAALARATEAGAAVLGASGMALDAVEAAIRVLEDDPLFNAGRGATFTFDGRIELDAAIMDGRDRAAGAVAGVSTVRNPVLLARAVMEAGPHVFLAGGGRSGSPASTASSRSIPRGSKRPSAAASSRSFARASPAGSTAASSTAPSAPSRATLTATLRRPPRPAGSPASAGAGSGIRR